VEEKRRSFRWRGINVVEWVEDELVAAWLGVAKSTVERECRERDLLQKTTEEEAGFFFIFGPDFLLSQVINEASIYRQWKRVISSTPG
jgi:hypothetical protein